MHVINESHSFKSAEAFYTNFFSLILKLISWFTIFVTNDVNNFVTFSKLLELMKKINLNYKNWFFKLSVNKFFHFIHENILLHFANFQWYLCKVDFFLAKITMTLAIFFFVENPFYVQIILDLFYISNENKETCLL